jgi:hypothetical protein
MLEGWTSGNNDIDKFIKDTIYNARNIVTNPIFLEWVSFDRFTNIKLIEFSKAYTAIWIDGPSSYKKYNNGSREKLEIGPTRVSLKKFSSSQNISDDYLSKVYSVVDILLFLYYFIC